MLILLLVLPASSLSDRKKCATGQLVDAHTLLDLTIAWCSSTRHTTCYTTRTRLHESMYEAEHLFVYGCGSCPYVEDSERDLQECSECPGDVCNLPHTYWNMTYKALPTKPPKVEKPFIPFKESKHFPQYEALAEPFIWTFPLACLVLVIVMILYYCIRAHIEDWYWWCVRYWQ